MAFKVSSWNDFYEGWLARCLLQPFDSARNKSWRDGWVMGDETGDEGIMRALTAEIKLGQSGKAIPSAHIIVEEIEEITIEKRAEPLCWKRRCKLAMRYILHGDNMYKNIK